MSTFNIQPLERFAGASATIRRPKEIACFSYDDGHRFRLDESSLRYYYPPKLPANLSEGFDTFQKLDDSADDHLESLLKTIMATEKETAANCEADIVTWRGMMTKIMASPFDNFNGFEMNATLFQGTIFIEENHDHKLSRWQSQRTQPQQPGRPSQDLMSFWGYKFETLSLIPNTWDATPREYIDNRDNEIVNNNAQYCSIVRTGIGKTKMVIGGEVDAVWDIKPIDKDSPINWVELKTSEDPQSERDMIKFERKLLKFWIQSFLLGVPKIIVGFRTKDGVLTRLEELQTATIPGTVNRRGKGTWNGNLCISFMDTFLDCEWIPGRKRYAVNRNPGLKHTIQGDGVWRIRRRERAAFIEVFKIEESGHGGILSPEFLEWRKASPSTLS
ncbi:MAG: decapping endonuclease targeting mRNA [Pycnora praestabilis]|nr:MAG: decapping endonuclease targeting mRNA [Pycnora praestabilis]